MKTGMILQVCNVRIYPFGRMIKRNACVAIAVLICALLSGTLRADTHYVNAVRLDDSGDGLTWATAEKTIQAAITASTAGDTITVTNGVYAPISTANKAITIQSVNGADVTIIDGGGVNRCANLGSSSSHTNTVLVGFTLRKGSAPVGGGSGYGTLKNCALSGNSATSDGGGAYYSVLNNCTLSENKASQCGGGAYYGRLNNCSLLCNSAAFSGGGSYYGILNNCMLSGNSAQSGGGSYFGTLNNCTLSGNSAATGGGSYDGTLNNCIVWGNTRYHYYWSGGNNNYSGGTFRYSCTTPLPTGAGNISLDPLLRLSSAGDYRLSTGSPCLNAGTNGYAVGSVDAIGNPRIQNGTVDMGACEGAGTLVTDISYLARNVTATGGTDGVAVSWEPPSNGGAVLYRVCRMDMVTGQWMPVSGWNSEMSFLDTQVFGGVSYRYALLVAFDAGLDIISGVSSPAEGQRDLIPQFYVDASRPNDAGDGRSWATAKLTIQAAIGIATPYDTILVTNGVYGPISTTDKMIEIRSVNGAQGTIIDGGGTNACVTLNKYALYLNSILIGFTLRNGNGFRGGGAYFGTLNNCMLTGSRATYGGGACYVTLNNCTLAGNSATDGGGSYACMLNNSTLTQNSASSEGAGSYSSKLNNCIAWGNTLTSGVTNNLIGGVFNYSCMGAFDPLFRLPAAGDYRLSPGSPCLNAGTNGYVVGSTDVLGNPRIQEGRVDMGAYEGAWALMTEGSYLARNVVATGGTDGIAVSWEPPSIGGAVLYRVFRLDMATGQWNSVSDWIADLSYLDKQVLGGVTYRYAVYSAFDSRFDVISGMSASAEGQRTWSPQFYVDASRQSDAGDGRSWATAKKTIQAAIDASALYNTILVTNGVYAPISTTNKTILIQSVNGAAVTIIDGGGTNRCATLGSQSTHLNSLIVGFTLRNGASSYGGGSYAGKLDNCTFLGNIATNGGGGSYYSILNTCTLSENSASYGGGSSFGTLNNCTLTGNNSTGDGGGSRSGTLNNCTLTGNRALAGGGSKYGTLNNCTLSGNIATYGGGSSGGTLNNCTLTGNSATYGGGSYDGTLNNCIVWGNFISGAMNNYTNSTFSYSCTTPLPSGTGNISSEPLFRDAISSNFILRVGSPCINAGSNAFVVGTTDLVGNPRIQSGTVDMGAYEMPPTVTVTFDANGGLLAAGQASTNVVGFTGDLYDSWLNLSNGISRVGYTFAGWFTAPAGGTPVLSSHAITESQIYAQWMANSFTATLDWQNGGDSLWFVQTNAVFQELSVMRSGVISDNQTSWIGTSVIGPGRFSFWWRVSSEGGYDELFFALDGIQKGVISGTKKDEWQYMEVAFSNASPHQLRWTYSKDDSVSEGEDCGWLCGVEWIPVPPTIPGNPNVSSNFLNNVTQAQVDALVAGLRVAHPDVTDAEIAQKFEDADLFGFTGAALVGVGTDALARFNPSIILATLSVSDGDPRMLVVTVTIGNNIDPTPAAALARIGEPISSRMKGIFKTSISGGEAILAPMLSLNSTTGVVTATFTLETPSAPSGFLRMSLRK